jgi:hypothetical protein
MEGAMATASTTGLYEFDPYGTNPANLITGERQTLQTPGRDDFYFIIPQAAPFFVKSMKLYNDVTNVEYVEGVDFLFGHYFPEAMDSIGSPIAGSIRFIKRDIAGIVRMDYRTLGGQWGFSDQAILTELSNKQYNPLIRSWGMIAPLPATFPPVPHDQSIDDLVGAEELRQALQDLADVAEAAAGGINDSHLQDFNNPHKVNKVQVGLGAVQNFPIATDLEMQLGQATNVYATSRGVALAIAAQALVPLNNFIARRDNPHEVTKAQVGLEFTPNFPVASPTEAIDPLITNRLMTPYTTALLINQYSESDRIQALEGALQAHESNYNNPHRVTAHQVGTLTEEEIRSLVTGGVATDTERFSGMTDAEWRETLPSFTDMTTVIENLGTEFDAASLEVQLIDPNDPTTDEERAEQEQNKRLGVMAGYDAWSLYKASWETTLVQTNAVMPTVFADGRSTFIAQEDAYYYIDDLGVIHAVGSAAIPTPTLPGTVANIWATKTAVYALLDDDRLLRYVANGTVTTLFNSGVSDVFCNNEDKYAGEFVLFQMDDGTLNAYGHAGFVSAVNTLITGLATNPDHRLFADVVIANDYMVFMFENRDVLVYAIGRSPNVTFTPVPHEGTWPVDWLAISGDYNHIALLGVDGKVYFRGNNNEGQQEVNQRVGPFISVACGKEFTVTLGEDKHPMYWGDSPTNALLPVGF